MTSPLQLFSSHTPLAYSLVNKMGGYGFARRTGVDIEDLQQVALWGLWHAAQRFDESKGFQFSTFAHRCISGYLLTHTRYYRFGKVSPDAPGRVDHPRQMKPVSEVSELLFIEDDPTPEAVSRAEIVEEIHRAIGDLNPRNLDALSMRFFQDEGFKEIGEALGVSKERGRQLTEDSLGKLRQNRRLQELAGMLDA